MHQIKKPIIATPALAGLGLIGSFMNSKPAVLEAAGGPTVTIDPSQLPLRVTGATTVAGTVAATQSGPWSVGIGNTSGNPALIRDVDVAARAFFQREISFTIQSGTSQASGTFTVPGNVVGAVIQYLDVHSAVSTGLKPFLAISASQGGNFSTFRPPVFLQGSSTPTGDFYTGAGPATIYADPGSTITCLVSTSANVVSNVGAGCSFSGYYIRVP